MNFWTSQRTSKLTNYNEKFAEIDCKNKELEQKLEFSWMLSECSSQSHVIKCFLQSYFDYSLCVVYLFAVVPLQTYHVMKYNRSLISIEQKMVVCNIRNFAIWWKTVSACHWKRTCMIVTMQYRTCILEWEEPIPGSTFTWWLTCFPYE